MLISCQLSSLRLFCRTVFYSQNGLEGIFVWKGEIVQNAIFSFRCINIFSFQAMAYFQWTLSNRFFLKLHIYSYGFWQCDLLLFNISPHVCIHERAMSFAEDGTRRAVAGFYYGSLLSSPPLRLPSPFRFVFVHN